MRLHRGGHDPAKIYNAYKRAMEHKGGPTVILAKTVKGYGMGTAQARNATHSEKKLTDEGLAAFVKRFEIPIPEEARRRTERSTDRRRTAAGDCVHAGAADASWAGICRGAMPTKLDFKAPAMRRVQRSGLAGSNGRAVSTTMGFVSILRHLMKDPAIGKLIVPIVPDEGRTFGLESAIRQVGSTRRRDSGTRRMTRTCCCSIARSRTGRFWRKALPRRDRWLRLRRRVRRMSNYKVPTIPFYMYYSMFGFQRIGDMAWAFADSRGKGFLMGGTAGRTTMLGEGLQHQDGHSHRAGEHGADLHYLRSGVCV